MSAQLAHDTEVADRLRLKLRLERDHQMRMRSKTFWKNTFGVKKLPAARIDSIRQLLDQRHIRVDGTDTFGREPDKTWLTLTIADVEPYPGDEWFQQMMEQTFESEAEVEYWFVLPLLEALGYRRADLAVHRIIPIAIGAKPKKIVADIAAFDGPGRDRALLIVEVKMPSRVLTGHVLSQAESYAFWSKAPAWLVTNATETRLYHRAAGHQSTMPLSFSRAELDKRWPDIIRHLSRESMVNHCRQFWGETS